MNEIFLHSICSFSFESRDEESDDDQSFTVGKLRSSKSISELCDALTQNTSLSTRLN